MFLAFTRFHTDNPIIWYHFKRFTFAVIGAGRDHYSSQAVFQRLRWHTNFEVIGGPSIKLNDHFSPFYARMFHVAYPAYAEFFMVRLQTSHFSQPFLNDSFDIDEPAGADKVELLNLRLLALLQGKHTGETQLELGLDLPAPAPAPRRRSRRDGTSAGGLRNERCRAPAA